MCSTGWTLRALADFLRGGGIAGLHRVVLLVRGLPRAGDVSREALRERAECRAPAESGAAPSIHAFKTLTLSMTRRRSCLVAGCRTTNGGRAARLERPLLAADSQWSAAHNRARIPGDASRETSSHRGTPAGCGLPRPRARQSRNRAARSGGAIRPRHRAEYSGRAIGPSGGRVVGGAHPPVRPFPTRANGRGGPARSRDAATPQPRE